MAQTQNAMTARDQKVELSTDGGTTWTDISGFASNVEVGGGDRQSGETYTYDGDTPIIGIGKREPIEMTLSIVYTEPDGEPWADLVAAYENGSQVMLRWSPAGGNTGDRRFVTSPAYVTSAVYPSGESSSGDPITIEATLRCAAITQEVIP